MKDKTVPFQPQFNSGIHSPVLFCLSTARERKLGSNLLFGSALGTDSQEAWPPVSMLKVSQISPTGAPDLRVKYPARPKATCGKQCSQSDGWARKSQWHTPKTRQSTFKERGMQQAVAPSHSLGDALSLKDAAGSASLTGWF